MPGYHQAGHWPPTARESLSQSACSDPGAAAAAAGRSGSAAMAAHDSGAGAAGASAAPAAPAASAGAARSEKEKMLAGALIRDMRSASAQEQRCAAARAARRGLARRRRAALPTHLAQQHARTPSHRAGELYIAFEPQLLEERAAARRLVRAFNTSEDEDERLGLLQQLLGGMDAADPPFIEPPLRVDYVSAAWR